MSKRDPVMLLEDMLAAMEKVERYTRGLDQRDFISDECTIDAVVRNLEIIGEAVRRMPEATTGSHPDIPWQKIAGMRNRIVHAYFGVDAEIVWQVVKGSLPTLSRQVSEILTDE